MITALWDTIEKTMAELGFFPDPCKDDSCHERRYQIALGATTNRDDSAGINWANGNIGGDLSLVVEVQYEKKGDYRKALAINSDAETIIKALWGKEGLRFTSFSTVVSNAGLFLKIKFDVQGFIRR
jgi:hypothetical protein